MNTTPQAPVDALMALVQAYSDAEHAHEGDYLLNEKWMAIERAARALAAIPAPAAEIAYTPGQWFDATTVDLMEAFYRSRLTAIREAAKEHGYAIGVHGSLRRDLDLIAAPWREGASDADTLAEAIHRAACGFTSNKYQWEQKPAGRIAVSVPICWTHRHGVLSDGHIDLSVIATLHASTPAEPDLESACLSLRHDFGLLPAPQRKALLHTAKEWARAFGIVAKESSSG